MIQYLQYGMSGVAVVMMVLGIYQILTDYDDKIPTVLPSDPPSQTPPLLKYNAAMLRAVGDQILGAVLFSGGFIGGLPALVLKPRS